MLSRREVMGCTLLSISLPAIATASPVYAAADAPPDRPPGPRPLTPESQQLVDKALAKIITKQKAPAALRLVFHDAATFRRASGDGGVNASVRFELDRPESFGLKRSWRLIEQLQQEVSRTPAAQEVSLSDLIVLAAAQAVLVTGGPRIVVPVGRRDATSADPPDRMPGETFTAAQLKDNFAAAGLNVREMIALSGSHTIGGKGFGDPVTFDNTYFTTLVARPWLNKADDMAAMIGLPSDHVLPEDDECLAIIQEYASDQAAFFTDFTAAFTKMSALNAVWA